MFTVVCCVFAVHMKMLTVVWFEQMDLESYALTAPSGTDESMESFPLTKGKKMHCLLYTSPSPRDDNRSRMPSSA